MLLDRRHPPSAFLRRYFLVNSAIVLGTYVCLLAMHLGTYNGRHKEFTRPMCWAADLDIDDALIVDALSNCWSSCICLSNSELPGHRLVNVYGSVKPRIVRLHILSLPHAVGRLPLGEHQIFMHLAPNQPTLCIRFSLKSLTYSLCI